MSDDLAEVTRAEYVNARCMTRSSSAGRRHDDFLRSSISQSKHRSQAPAGSAQSAVEGEFADQAATGELMALEQAGCRENADGNGQIEARAVLTQFRGCEIDGDPAIRETQTGGGDGASNSRNALTDRCFGEADDVDPG